MVWDPLVEERVAPNVTVPRDEKQNPLVIPRGGDAPVPYTRASSLSDFLTYDSHQISRWRERYKLQGIARHADLRARVAAVFYSTGPITGNASIEDRRRAAAEIDSAGDEGAERMGISEAANLGTAGHSLTEPGSQGEIAPELADVVAGYNDVTASLERVASEVFVVNDTLRAAGTFDSAYLDPINLPGFVIIGDTKTGKNYHQAEFEMQLAVYQGGELYLGADGGRLTFEEAFGLPVNTDVAYLVHVSVTGSPKPRVVKLDLVRGRRLAQLAADVRDARREIDSVGVGEKFNHREANRQALDIALEALDGDMVGGVRNAVQVRAVGLTLMARYRSVWGQADTDFMKAMLS